MKKKDIMLALLTVLIWGVNFTVIKLGLSGVPSMLLVVLRYLATAFPAIFFIKKPKIEWKYIIIYGLFVGVLQFSSLFYAMELGMPAGLASIILQFQAFASPAFAFIFLKEKLKAKQIIGSLVAIGGLTIIAMETVSGGISEIPILAIILTIATPVFWAASNIIARVASDKAAANGDKLDMFGLVIWSALIPPIPILIFALMIDTPETLINAILNMNGMSIFAVFYLAFGATLFGYGVWGMLVAKYPMGKVAPITLLVPIIGLLTANIVLHEQLSSMQWIGASVILLGLLITNLNFKSLIGYFNKSKVKQAETI
ncbi:MAG: EamA family transporter [Sedimentibacter sp.]